MSTKITTLKKPALDANAVRAFAEGDTSAPKAQPAAQATPKTEKPATGKRIFPAPAGDVRMTANIREDLHIKLKIEAAKRRTTVGELIEQMIESLH